MYIYKEKKRNRAHERERTRSSCTREQRTLYGELYLVRCVLLQLVGNRYPFKAIRTLKKVYIPSIRVFTAVHAPD